MRILSAVLVTAAVALPAPARDVTLGRLDAEGGDESLLSGVFLACESTLTLAWTLLADERCACRLPVGWGNRVRMLSRTGPCVSGSHALTAPWPSPASPAPVRASGSGTAACGMLLPPENASPWGVFAGGIAWRLD